MTEPVYDNNVDLRLLREQARCLSEIQEYLTTGEPCANADAWPEAIEGVLNLLAALERSAKERRST